jgi:AcrR family transcriptional regulator
MVDHTYVYGDRTLLYGAVARRARQRRLDREDWIGAALDALADGGVRALAIERLAKRVGATRGSFYWHFQDRAELLQAALERWERENTSELIPDAEAIGDPAERLRFVIGELYEQPVDAIELTLAGAAGDPAIDDVVARVTRTRVEFLQRIFLDLGLSEGEAGARAWLAYAFYVGHHQLGTVPGLGTVRPARLEQVTALLTAPASRDPRGPGGRAGARPGRGDGRRRASRSDS